MKKNLQKVIAMALASVMVMGTLAGCGAKEETTQTAEKPAETTTATETKEEAPAETAEAAYPDYSGGFSDKVTIQIPVYDRAFEGWNVTDNTYTKWVQSEFGDKYNINVEYVAIGRGTEVADYMQMIAAGTAPSIIMHYDMPQAVNYFNEGAMQPLDVNEIANYAPTYYANLGSTIDTYGEMDGQTMFFFAERPTMYYQWVTLVRQDWLDKVGAAMPTSVEELNAVAQSWKDAGLGKLGETLLFNNFTYHYGYIGNSVDQNDINLYSDLAVASLPWSASEAYLKNLNYQYNNGLVDPEFYLKDEDAKTKADFIAGKTGTYGLYLSSSTDVITSLLANDPGAKLATLPIRAKVPAGNNPYYYEYPAYGMIMGMNSTCTDEQRAAVWMYLEWLSQPENLFQYQYGVEGESYTMDADGLAVRTPDYAGDWKVSNNNNKDYWCLVVEAIVYEDDALTYKSNIKNWAPEGYEYLIEDNYKYFQDQEPYGLINPIFTAVVETSSESAADLRELWKQLYVKVATGSEADFDANYKAACEEYLDAGYQAILDEKQELINTGALK